jgi:hypothetical protein
MIRSAIAGMIAAAVAAAPGYGQAQSQQQPHTSDYPYQEQKPPAGEIVRDVIQDALDARAKAREERRRREFERREWELRQQQQQIPPRDYYEPPPVAVAPVPEPSSPADPAFDPEPAPVPAATRPAPAKPVTPKAVPASQVASTAPKPNPAQKVPPVADRPVATPPLADVPEPAPPQVTEPPPVVAQAPAPIARKVTTDEPRLSSLVRWSPLALLALLIAAAGGGWSVRQRRVRVARTRSALSLNPRLDQQAGASSTTPIKLAAPRVSIRTRLEYS